MTQSIPSKLCQRYIKRKEEQAQLIGGCRIHKLHFYRGVRLPHNDDIKQSDGEASVMRAL